MLERYQLGGPNGVMVQIGSTVDFQSADEGAVPSNPTNMRVEISSLPKRPFQRSYIDEFFNLKSLGLIYLIEGRKVMNAGYGHCANYPNGFWVEFA